MLRKILKISLLIICVGFVSAFIRGYKSFSETNKLKEQGITNHEVRKQELIDEEIIISIINTNEESEETNNPVQEEQETSKKKLIIQM